MSRYNCYLCASDEGILLDIFGDAGKPFREYIETCLSVKVKQEDAPSTKICHKCAYELESCKKFLVKYQCFREADKEHASSKQRGHCRLCGETPQKLRLLLVRKGNSLKNLLHKLQQVFLDNSFKEDIASFSVCLDCRYNLDVLSDLKIIHHESVKKLRNVNENGLKLSDLPKTKTSVVSRKTTYVPVPKLNGNLSYESDTSTSSSSRSNITMPMKRKQGRPRKEPIATGTTMRIQFRNCEECETQVEHGIDMYRYHRSGRTVCRDCWLTMDPEKMSNEKRKKLASSDPESGTKLCAVFLKDVLLNPSKYNNIYKVEKDEDGNKTFLITDESSENEEKDKTFSKRLRARAANSSTPTSLETITEVRKAVKRSLPRENKIEHETVKKGRTRRSDESVEKEDEVEHKTVTRGRSRRSDDSVEKEDKIEHKTVKRGRPRRSDESVEKEVKIEHEMVKKGKTRRSDESVETSPVPVKTKRARNGLAAEVDSTMKTRSRRGSSESTTTSARLSPEIGKKSPPAKKTTRPVRDTRVKKLSSDEKSHEGESSSNESRSTSEKSKKKKEIIITTKNKARREGRRKRSNSFTGSTVTAPVTTLPDDLSSEDSPSSLNARKTKKVSKISKHRIQNAKSDSELDRPYTCSVCQLGCKNKLVGKSHELTHEKQPEVKLRRVVVSAAFATPETIVEETPLEVCQEKGESKDPPEDEEENGVVDQNPEQPETSEEKPETEENTLISEKPVSNEQAESSPVREESNKEETLEQKLDDEDEEEEKNKEETHLPVEEERDETVETPKLVDEDEPLSQKNKTYTNENEENAANENKENDNSEERINKEKEEKNDKVEETFAEAKELCEVEVVESVESTTTTLIRVKPEETINVTSTENSEEKTQNNESEKTSKDSEPMEVTEIDEKEKIVEENEDPIVEDAEKEVNDNNVIGTKEDDEFPEKVEPETEPDSSTTKTTSETKEETSDVIETIDEQEKQQVKEKSNEEGGEEVEAEEEKEKEEETKEPAETIDSTIDEDKEKEDQVSLVVEESKENEKQDEKSEKKEEEKEEESEKIVETRGEEERSNESATIAAECLREVFDLANAEVKRRLENENTKEDTCTTPETLENISLEIQNGADMPSLELEVARNDKS